MCGNSLNSLPPDFFSNLKGLTYFHILFFCFCFYFDYSIPQNIAASTDLGMNRFTQVPSGLFAGLNSLSTLPTTPHPLPITSHFCFNIHICGLTRMGFQHFHLTYLMISPGYLFFSHFILFHLPLIVHHSCSCPCLCPCPCCWKCLFTLIQTHSQLLTRGHLPV